MPRGAGSGLLATTNTESDLARLTLAFSLSASLAQPVIVRIESIAASGARSGGFAAVVIPAAADFHQRFAVELGTMTPFGAGRFQPLDPRVQFSFEIASEVGGDGWPSTTRNEVRVDNIHFASPAFYVSPIGNDTSSDGRSAATAFRAPQGAINLAQPGDIVCSWRVPIKVASILSRPPAVQELPRGGSL